MQGQIVCCTAPAVGVTGTWVPPSSGPHVSDVYWYVHYSRGSVNHQPWTPLCCELLFFFLGGCGGRGGLERRGFGGVVARKRTHGHGHGRERLVVHEHTMTCLSTAAPARRRRAPPPTRTVTTGYGDGRAARTSASWARRGLGSDRHRG